MMRNIVKVIRNLFALLFLHWADGFLAYAEKTYRKHEGSDLDHTLGDLNKALAHLCQSIGMAIAME